MPNLSPSQQPPHNRRFYFKGFTKVCQYMRIAVCHANSYYLNQFIISFSSRLAVGRIQIEFLFQTVQTPPYIPFCVSQSFYTSCRQAESCGIISGHASSAPPAIINILAFVFLISKCAFSSAALS